MTPEMKTALTAHGIDWTNLKDGIRRLLPVLETVTRLTPTPADDAVVALLKAILAEQVSVGV